MLNGNLRLAVQKKGRLTEKSLQLLRNSGLDIEEYSERLVISARNYELDLLFLRDDDIPEYVQDGVADIGIVGEDIIFEKRADVKIIRKLGYGKCRLALALPETKHLENLEELNGQRIATSFPHILQNFLDKNNLKAKIVEISGSVEIAPSLGVADYICDLVSTGNTLKLNKLKKSFDVFESQAALIAGNNLESDENKNAILQNF
ncbi:MAG: ATP phosphoribosyltransferase, partial [Ignavibacteria bacterium]|nr:ATP phosphoribosyltransferase [Ignavibacteria bacterium]